MDLFYKELSGSESFGKVVRQLGGKINSHIGIQGPSDSQKAHYIYALLEKLNKKCVFVSPNEFAAKKMYEDFGSLTGGHVIYLPAQEYLLYNIEAKSHEIQHKRLEILTQLQTKDFEILVISAEVLAQRLPDHTKINTGCISITINDSLDTAGLINKLTEIGYERYDIVQGRGQFSVRGGIIDIYPVNMPEPVRIDLFGDDIDSIRLFDVSSQRSTEEIESVEITPAREIYFSKHEKQKLIEELKSLNLKAASDDIERLENYDYFPGIDKFTPLFLKNYDTVLDYVTDDCVVVMDESSRIWENLETIESDFAERCKNMLEKNLIIPELTELYSAYGKFYSQLKNKNTIFLKTLGNFKEEKIAKSKIITMPARIISGFGKNVQLLIEQINQWKNSGYKVAIVVGNEGRKERFTELLSDAGLDPTSIVFVIGNLHSSFEYPDLKLTVISDNELFVSNVKKGGRKTNRQKGKAINSFTDLSPGDFVVHDIHGIGQYMGLEQVTVAGVVRDYIKVKYSDSGFLYVPTNQMDIVQKYIGSQGHAPRLSQLGGSDWNRAKKRVKESLRELAAELVALYAKRQASRGFAFTQDTIWQTEFEEAFPFEETEDQLKCIEEIKRDMEAIKPMERLLCGDVGYGKTEVALRAVFKAVLDGKQVAFLVPTTVLAQQHYNNFCERFKNFPVNVDFICRFRTPSEQKAIMKNLKRGEIDVLIGTHSLLNKGLEFKDLGLLVVDEEQRFGVGHKEKIKTMKPNVDILTLSATPIPRTLHMSMVQIRDISIIEDPPEERHPVQTYVMEYDPKMIREAIYRELGRSGQVFYLYNKVRTINVKAAELADMVPEARIGVAHGQMSEKELEHIMMEFLNGEYDVLVCTTIIESGLDMANVNTIIIEEGDHLGLAQLYQLRGRVGRSSKVAYAYITYKKDKVLTEFSEKRLQTIREFTEFGSGFKIAMRDLEIRGAGNLLGTQQHGQMESVGYDMYVKLLDRAVKEIGGIDSDIIDEEVTIEVAVSAYIDTNYISGEEERLEMYKKISLINSEEDVLDVKDEFIDRYGNLPKEAENLISVAWIKSLAKRAGFSSITESNDLIIFKFMKNSSFDPEKIADVMDRFNRRIVFNAGTDPYIAYKKIGGKAASSNDILKKIEEIILCF